MGLFLSVTTASSELNDSPISKAIIRRAAQVASLSRLGRMPDGPTLDITFMLPGKLDKPGFVGMRMGGYTHGDDTLYFEVAVPERLIASDLTDAYLEVVLEDVVENAGDFFSEHRIDFDKPAWSRVVGVLARGEAQKPELRLVGPA